MLFIKLEGRACQALRRWELRVECPVNVLSHQLIKRTRDRFNVAIYHWYARFFFWRWDFQRKNRQKGIFDRLISNVKNYDDCDVTAPSAACIWVGKLCWLIGLYWCMLQAVAPMNPPDEDYVNDNPIIEMDDSGTPVCPPAVKFPATSLANCQLCTSVLIELFFLFSSLWWLFFLGAICVWVQVRPWNPQLCRAKVCLNDVDCGADVNLCCYNGCVRTCSTIFITNLDMKYEILLKIY